MNTKLVSLACILTLIQTGTNQAFTLAQKPMLFGMTVQFPHVLKNTPDIRAYCAGHIIKGNVNNKRHSLDFSIPEDRYTTEFTLLVTNTNAIDCIVHENTVLCLTVDSTQPYKMYSLALKEHIIPNPQPQSDKEPRTHYIWEIRPLTLEPDHNCRIPDSTIILCYNPEYIAKLEGGNAVQLPTIYIKENVLNLAGSELKLHEQSAEFLLASLDYDALHTSIKQCIKPFYASKTVLTLTT